MKIRQQIPFAITGWIAGIIIMLGVGFIIFPAIMQGDRFTLSTANVFILSLVFLIMSPAALLGGWVGSRLPKEGGVVGEFVAAALMGIIFSVPFSCLAFWYSGW